MAAAAIFNFSEYAFLIKQLRSIAPLNLMMIGTIVKKWQPIFEIKDGGGRHL